MQDEEGSSWVKVIAAEEARFEITKPNSLNNNEGFNPLKDSGKFLYLNIHVLLLDIQGNVSS